MRHVLSCCSCVLPVMMALACSSGAGGPSLSLPDGTLAEDGTQEDAVADLLGGEGHTKDNLEESTAYPDTLPQDSGTQDATEDIAGELPIAEVEVSEDLILGCKDDSDCYGLHCLVEEGICVGCVTFEQCDDGNPCTFDYCGDIHECVHNPLTGECDDGNSCTSGDHCEDLACVPTATIECVDDNPCTDDVCPDGTCVHSPNSDPCEDGDPCTLGDACAGGMCIAGFDAPICDDGLQCTSDACVPLVGCAYTPVEGACDDGDSCTGGDHCVNSQCLPETVIPCDDGDQCTKDECDVAGGCFHTPTPGAACDDGDPCTQGETCQQEGGCGNAAPAACDDENPCTADKCEPGVGCQFVQVDGVPCDDGNPCTTGDVCASGSCLGSAMACSDGNPCTADGCSIVSGQCFHENLVQPCDDGNPCTVDDMCVAGTCLPGSPLACDDGNPCTKDSCDPAVGCVTTPADGQACDDGQLCTEADTCTAGVCAGSWKGCTTPNPCATALCDPMTGFCAYSPLNGTPCDDKDACTGPDVCVTGLCKTTPVTCNDGKECTDDSCNPATGCVYQPKTGGICNDGNSCTSGDTCVAGVCQGQGAIQCNDGNVCTDDTCSPNSAGSGCQYVPKTGGSCDDNNSCTVNDSCVNGTCSGQAVGCGDGNPCTSDSCVNGTGCVYTPLNGGECNDGNACSSGDTCIAGVCKGTEHSCNDGNPCTEDSCNPATGCVYSPLTGPSCNDNSLCTSGDVCTNGTCGGKSISCDDGNFCTYNQCLPQSGCYFPSKNGDACDDNDPCTGGDQCWNSACHGGYNVCECQSNGDCDDNDPCTSDYCSNDHTCIHSQIPGCSADSCQGKCGQWDYGWPCNCDAQCFTYQDCCGDVCDFCNYEKCSCQPSCDGKKCGPDGCGGSCGTCPSGSHCSNQSGLCVPCSCAGKQCGGDGCGNSCGQCGWNQWCMNGQCMGGGGGGGG